jgi:histone acetyltransferase MYST1
MRNNRRILLSELVRAKLSRLCDKMADGGVSDKENVGEKLENAFIKQERRTENSQSDNKVSGDNEDADSVEEQPLDIGEHYLVRRSDGSWRK